MEDTSSADQLTVEQLRANAFASAAASLLQLAINSQKEAIEYLGQNLPKLEEFVTLIDSNAPTVPLARTLVAALAVTLANAHRAPTYEESRATFTNGTDLLQKLGNYNQSLTPKSTYDILKNYFPDANSDTPQVYPDFTPEKVEQNLGPVGANLYNWMDATFSLLQSKFDE